jgi:integrase
LHFPFDKDLGYKPPAKDFYASTAAEADRLRRAWKPEVSTLDKATSLLDYVNNVFLPEQLAKSEQGALSFSVYQNRLWRLKKYLVDPDNEGLASSRIRLVKLGALQPHHVSDYFKAVLMANVNQEASHRLKDDLQACLKSARHKIPHPVRLYFEDLDVPALPKRIKPLMVFDPQMIFAAITDESKPIEDRALVAFQFIMQCRPSEMFALTWDDIDLETGSVTFYKKVAQVKKPGLEARWDVIETPKTGQSGVRTIALGAGLVALLTELRKKSKNGKGFVFCSAQGKMLHKERFKDMWPKVKRSLSLPDGPTFYSLKHLGNSFAISQGISTQVQGKRMGHTSDRMARQVYREILDTEMSQSVAVFDKKLTELGA